jgi:hypothetical protein
MGHKQTPIAHLFEACSEAARKLCAAIRELLSCYFFAAAKK